MDYLKNIRLIYASDPNNGIGLNNTIPWKSSEDMAFFRSVTMGHNVLMGRRTWESLGKPLVGRDNVIVTRRVEEIAGVTSFHPDRLSELKNPEGLNPFRYPTTFVIGGRMLYDEFPNPEFIYHTVVHSTEHQVDTYGPSLCLSDYELLAQRYIFDVTRPKQIPITTNIYIHKASK